MVSQLTSCPGKLVDAICHPESKLDEHVKRIEREIGRLNALKEASHMAQNTDMMKMVAGTGEGNRCSNLRLCSPMSYAHAKSSRCEVVRKFRVPSRCRWNQYGDNKCEA